MEIDSLPAERDDLERTIRQLEIERRPGAGGSSHRASAGSDGSSYVTAATPRVLIEEGGPLLDEHHLDAMHPGELD